MYEHRFNSKVNTLIAAAIFRKLAKKKRRQIDFFYMSEYEITRSLACWKGIQCTLKSG